MTIVGNKSVGKRSQNTRCISASDQPFPLRGVKTAANSEHLVAADPPLPIFDRISFIPPPSLGQRASIVPGYNDSPNSIPTMWRQTHGKQTPPITPTRVRGPPWRRKRRRRRPRPPLPELSMVLPPSARGCGCW